MKCELNIVGGRSTGHESPARWTVTNKHGTDFKLCDGCVAVYKEKIPDWEQRGLNFVPLEKRSLS